MDKESAIHEVVRELIQVASNPWVAKSVYARDLGVSDGVIETWMRRWTRGDQYKVIGRQTLVHRERANRWIDEQENGQPESGPEVEASRSRSGAGRSGFTARSSSAIRTSLLNSPV
jgi:hypothetical protein